MLRFGVRAISGRCAATWKVWSEAGGEVYITTRPLGGCIKASLHASGQWHVALEREAFEGLRMTEAPQQLRTRFADRWLRPSEIRPGTTLAYQIVVPWYSATSRAPITRDDIVWVPPAPEAHAVEFAVLFTDRSANPGQWPGQRAMSSQLVGSFRLCSGQHVWVVWTVQPFQRPPTIEGRPAYFVKRRAKLLPPTDLRAVVFAHTEDGARVMYDLPIRRETSGDA